MYSRLHVLVVVGVGSELVMAVGAVLSKCCMALIIFNISEFAVSFILFKWFTCLLLTL